jgi:hypothetical protein
VKPKDYFKTCLKMARYDSIENFCDRLEIELPERIRVVESILRMLTAEEKIAVDNNEEEELLCDLWKWLANAHRGTCDFAASTACFTKLAIRHEDAGQVKSVTKEVDRNKQLMQAFDAFPDKALAREYAALIWGKNDYRVTFDDHSLHDYLTRPKNGHSRIREMRKLWFGYNINGHGSETYFMSEQPVWLVRRGHAEVRSGPRTGAFSFGALEYFQSTVAASAPPTFLVTNGVRSENANCSCTFDVRRPVNSQDWERSEKDFLTAINQSETLLSTQVGFAFGIRDVNSESRKAYPMRGEGVLLGKGRVEYVRFIELNDEPGKTSHPTPFQFDVSAHAQCDIVDTYTHPMNIAITANTVTAQINGREHHFARIEPETGFMGLLLKGPGYVKVSNLTIDRPVDKDQPAPR